MEGHVRCALATVVLFLLKVCELSAGDFGEWPLSTHVCVCVCVCACACVNQRTNMYARTGLYPTKVCHVHDRPRRTRVVDSRQLLPFTFSVQTGQLASPVNMISLPVLHRTSYSYYSFAFWSLVLFGLEIDSAVGQVFFLLRVFDQRLVLDARGSALWSQASSRKFPIVACSVLSVKLFPLTQRFSQWRSFSQTIVCPLDAGLYTCLQ